MTKNKCNFYNNLLFDMSQFNGFYSGHDCTTYSKVSTESITYLNSAYSSNIFFEIFTQDRAYEDTTWSILSLDLAFGLIGGLIALVW